MSTALSLPKGLPKPPSPPQHYRWDYMGFGSGWSDGSPCTYAWYDAEAEGWEVVMDGVPTGTRSHYLRATLLAEARRSHAEILHSIRMRQKRRKILAEKRGILAALNKLPLRRLREIRDSLNP